MEIFNDQLHVSFSEIGAEAVSIKYFGEEILWQKQKGFWQSQAPILFPFCGFLKNGFYLHQENKYESSVHGFAASLKFTIQEKTNTKIVYSLVQNDKTLEQYPFNFELKASYELIDNELLIEFKVTNSSQDIDLPYSIGWHPGFIFKNGAFLQFSKNSFSRREVSPEGLIGQSKNYALVDGTLKLNHETFETGGIVLERPHAYIKLVNPSFQLSFQYEDFPHLVLWGQPGANFVCVEPWHGMGDTIDHDQHFIKKDDLIILKTEQSKLHSLSLLFSEK